MASAVGGGGRAGSQASTPRGLHLCLLLGRSQRSDRHPTLRPTPVLEPHAPPNGHSRPPLHSQDHLPPGAAAVGGGAARSPETQGNQSRSVEIQVQTAN